MTTFKSAAEVKRICKEGVYLTMIRHDWFPNGHLIGKSRKIVHAGKGAIAFQDVLQKDKISWLHWPLASEFLVTYNELGGELPDNIFGIALNKKENKWMYYRLDL